MSQDIVEGKRKQLAGQMKIWWGKLTADDWEKARGNREKIIGLLQEKYGWKKEQAMAEYDKRMKDYDAMEKTPPATHK